MTSGYFGTNVYFHVLMSHCDWHRCSTYGSRCNSDGSVATLPGPQLYQSRDIGRAANVPVPRHWLGRNCSSAASLAEPQLYQCQCHSIAYLKFCFTALTSHCAVRTTILLRNLVLKPVMLSWFIFFFCGIFQKQKFRNLW